MFGQIVSAKTWYFQSIEKQTNFWQTPTSNQKAFKLSAESDPLTDCKAKWILIRQFLSCRNKPSDINLKPPNNFCEVKKFLATRLLGYTTISRSGGYIATPPWKCQLYWPKLGFIQYPQNNYKIVGYMPKIGSKTSKTAKWQPFKKKFGRKTTYP